MPVCDKGGMDMNEAKKNSGLKIIVAILAIAVLGCFIWINTLTNEINRLSQSMHSQHQVLMNQVESIYSNVENMLQEEASLLSGVEVEYGDIDFESRTIEVSVKLVPKMISDDMKAELSIHGRTSELARSGNVFSGSIAVDLFNHAEQMLLTIETNAGIQTQYLNEVRVEYFWQEHIPSLYGGGISDRGTLSDGKYLLDGMLELNFSLAKETPEASFEKFVLVTELNGEEIGREDISEEVLNADTYLSGFFIRRDYKLEVEAKEGDELAIRLEATDSLGLRHTQLLHFWKKMGDAYAEAMDGTEYIYDPDGVLIFP